MYIIIKKCFIITLPVFILAKLMSRNEQKRAVCMRKIKPIVLHLHLTRLLFIVCLNCHSLKLKDEMKSYR